MIHDKQIVECLAGLHTLEQVYWVDIYFFIISYLRTLDMDTFVR